MNLRIKMIAPVILALSVFAFSIHFYWRPIVLEQEILESTEHEENVLRSTVPGLLGDLLASDLGAVYVTLDRLHEINSDKGYQITLLNSQGNQLYPLTLPTAISSPQILELVQKLETENHHLGSLHVRVNWQKRYEEVTAQIWTIELIVLSLFGFILLTILVLQDWIIIRPLILIKDASQRLAKGDFEINLPATTNDEVGELARSFDNMRHNLMQSQDELTQKVAEAKRANDAKSEFLSRMSHELRTPMNAILGFAQVLELDADDFNQTQQGNVKEIIDAGHHLLNIINEILDLSRIESGRMEIAMEKISLDDVVKQCITLIQSQADDHQLELIDNISGNSHIVQADFTRLKQILLNLLSNAVKYNRANGQIILDCKPIDNHSLRISVTDTGEGLSAEETSKLFIPFERLNVKDNTEGTGIGLVISKRLTELMGGTMGIESKQGTGSTFWLDLEQTIEK